MKHTKSGALSETSILTLQKETLGSSNVPTVRTQSQLPEMSLGKSFRVTPLGLVAVDGVSLPEWQKAGNVIAKVRGWSSWIVGDWIRIAIEKAKEDANWKKYNSVKSIAKEYGINHQTARSTKYVSERFPELFMRINSLDWNHHLVVSPLPPDERQYWLSLAAEKGWSVATLRKEIKGADYKAWLRYTDVWNFSDCDDRFGLEYPGRIPGQIIQNLLYYYTDPGDFVIDPMAGGGTTLDVCKHMDRECTGFDVRPSRDDILQVDSSQEWPATKAARLIFVDPPYWSQMAKDYEGIAARTYGEFLKAMEAIFLNSKGRLKPDGVLAILIAPMAIKTEYIDITFDFVKLLESHMTLVRRISVPVGSQQVGPSVVKSCKDSKTLVALNRDLLILR